MKTSKEKMRLEAFLNQFAEQHGLLREHQFCPGRRWRFDWVFVSCRVAIEYEGGVFIGGGHTRGGIYGQNCEKYNAAALSGWKVLRYTAPMIRSGMHEDQIRRALNA